MHSYTAYGSNQMTQFGLQGFQRCFASCCMGYNILNYRFYLIFITKCLIVEKNYFFLDDEKDFSFHSFTNYCNWLNSSTTISAFFLQIMVMVFLFNQSTTAFKPFWQYKYLFFFHFAQKLRH